MDAFNFSDGDIGLELAFANRAGAIEGADWVLVALDTDRNARTGGPDGAEYVIFAGTADRTLGLARWAGEDWDFSVPQDSLESDGKVVWVNRSELEGAMAFDFRVIAGVGEEENYDSAPDGNAVYSFALDLTPAISPVKPTFTPKQPAAGKLFAAAVPAITIDTGAKVKPGAVTCTAKLAGKALKPVAKCRWRLPANAKGKKLVVSVGVTYKGAKAAAKPATFKVR